jgi:uncharacterized protein
LEKEEVESLKCILEKDKDDISRVEENFLDRLIINNFVVPGDVDETILLEEKYNNTRNNNNNVSITILPTLDCNFSCRYCYQGNAKNSEEMSLEVQDKWIRFIKEELNGNKSISITWFGGEPTLSLHVIKRMSDILISYCDRNNIYYTASFITNGYNLTPELVGELYVRRVRYIQITFDGPSEVHNQVRFLKPAYEDKGGSFDRIIQNINDFVKEYSINTVLRVNVEKRNINQCYQLVDELSEKIEPNKNVSIYFSPVRASTPSCSNIADYTLDAMEFAEMETKLIEYAFGKKLLVVGLPMHNMGLCVATNKHGYVGTPNGDIHKCWETVSYPEHKVGDIENQNKTLTALWEKWRSWTPFKEKACRDCKILPNCVGFCAYSFLYPEHYSGNSAALPCPSIKFELENRLKLYLDSHNLA